MSSILAADFGSVHTRVVLMDLVDGSYRLTARAYERTTADFPHNDAGIGLTRGIGEIAAVTGRRLTGADGKLIVPEQQDRSGVDEFVATASAGRPLRAMLVGLVPEISIASGLRAAAGTYVEIVETFSLHDTRSEEERLNAIVRSSPDMILIAGGTEDGAREPVLELVQVIHLALRLLERPRRPVILYAGNSALVPQIRDLFNDLTKLFIAPNVRPSLEKEDLDGAQLQLGLAFDAYKENRGRGFGPVGDMSRLGVLPTAQGYNLLVEYLGKAQSGDVLAVDVGSAVSSLSASVDGTVYTTIRTDLGLGHSAYTLLATLDSEAIRRWLPFYITDGDLAAYARNKTLRPVTIPESLYDLHLEYALLRAGIEELVSASRPTWYPTAIVPGTPIFEPIIGAGAALAQTGNGGLSAMLLLDALQPEGMTTLQTDPYGLMPVLGALAYFKPEAVVQVLESSGFERLGMAFSLSGQPHVDRPALDVTIVTPDDTIKHQIDGGHLWIYPLAMGQEAEVTVRVRARGASIGGKRRVRLTVEGGAAGLIFDTRGRPLPLALDVADRSTQLVTWHAEAAGIPVPEIPPEWVQPPVDTTTSGRFGRRLRRLDRSDEDEEEPEIDELLQETAEEETDDIRNALS